MVDTTVSSGITTQSKALNLLKVLGPAHIWALGVGIVLVGEFMGWNYAVGKGGAFGALVACFVIVAATVINDPVNSLIGYAILIAGVPAFLYWRRSGAV